MAADTTTRPTPPSEDAGLRIGLALSGGGIRAAIFHLGVLSRLAAEGMIENVTAVSTVSGGSLIIALIFAQSDLKWPSSAELINVVVPKIRHLLTTFSMQSNIFWRGIRKPWSLYSGRAKCLSETLRMGCAVHNKLSDLPDYPRWFINATTYESGKNWRFTKSRMGDYKLNYVENPDFNIADAVAASAAYPGLIGPMALKTGQYEWARRVRWDDGVLVPANAVFTRLHLWDGGVYDNLGVEALYKPQEGLKNESCDFLIVSDAGSSLDVQRSRFLHKAAFRLVHIAMDQVRGLRARSIVASFERGEAKGVYLRIGNTARYIRSECGVANNAPITRREDLADQLVGVAARHPTDLRKLSRDQFDLIMNHGWEVTDCTLCGRHSDKFVPFAYPQK